MWQAPIRYPWHKIDRFLFKLRMEHVDRSAELAVLDTWGKPKAACELETVSRGEVVAARDAIRHDVALSPLIKECLVDCARALRADKRIIQGVSTRALVQAIPALQALAALRGRDYVSSEDVAYLLPLLMWHRIEFIPGVADPAEVILSAAGRRTGAVVTFDAKKMIRARLRDAALMVAVAGLSSVAIADQRALLNGGTPERALLSLLDKKKFIGAREAASKILRTNPNSIIARYALAQVYSEEEGNLPRALYHHNKALDGLEKLYGVRPSDAGVKSWHRRLLLAKAQLFGEMDRRLEQLRDLRPSRCTV